MVNTSDKPEQPGGKWLHYLAENRQRSAYILIGLGIVVGLLAVGLLWWEGFRFTLGFVLLCVLGALAALIPIGVGIAQLVRAPGKLAEIDLTRLIVLAVGGLLGLDLFLVAGVLALEWWTTAEREWRSVDLWIVLAFCLSGLGLLFASLQLGRSEERENALLRRMIYGYNAILTGLLLLGILIFVNFLAHRHLSADHDWTVQSLYSLSPQSVNILEHMKRPAKIYAILPANAEAQRLVRALITNCREVNPNIQVEYLSPDLSRDRIAELSKEYKFGDRAGLLVVSGRKPNEDSHFISYNALFSGSGPSITRRQQQQSQDFKGEDELLSALAYLDGGKKKPVIYFVQGNGELDITDTLSQQIDQGAGQLKRRLEDDNFVVKGLRFSELPEPSLHPDIVVAAEVPTAPTTTLAAAIPADTNSLTVASTAGFPAQAPFHILIGNETLQVTEGGATTPFWKVHRGAKNTKAQEHAKDAVVRLEQPEDAPPPASVVVLAGPKQPLPDVAMNALRQYLRTPGPNAGKLLVLVDQPVPPAPPASLTGLDEMLREYGVEVGTDRLICLPSGRGDGPLDLIVQANPSSDNPIASGFRRYEIPMYNLSSVRSGNSSGRFFADELFLVSPSRQRFWVETNPRFNPLGFFRPDNMAEIQKKLPLISREPVSIAVAVSEPDSSDPHALMAPRIAAQRPRLLVIGDVTFASNPFISSPQVGTAFYDLFHSSISWLEDRPATIGIKPKQRDVFELNLAQLDYNRLYFLPLILMIVGILGLGMGVWIIRRR